MVEIMRHPITDATAWKGCDLANDDSWIYHLKSQETRDLENALKTFKKKRTPWWEMREGDFDLPVLGPVLLKLRDELENGRGVVLLRGFPVEGYTVEEIQTMYFVLSTHMGWMISQNPMGDLIETHTTTRAA